MPLQNTIYIIRPIIRYGRLTRIILYIPEKENLHCRKRQNIAENDTKCEARGRIPSLLSQTFPYKCVLLSGIIRNLKNLNNVIHQEKHQYLCMVEGYCSHIYKMNNKYFEQYDIVQFYHLTTITLGRNIVHF